MENNIVTSMDLTSEQKKNRLECRTIENAVFFFAAWNVWLCRILSIRMGSLKKLQLINELL